jgi:hypothetical protein
MMEDDRPKRSPIPEWAEQERPGDLGWVRENLDDFWLAAQRGYAAEGRGAIVVDTTVALSGAGHPFGYFPQAFLEQGGDAATLALIGAYDPSQEFVTVLIKTENRVSTYRVQVVTRAAGEEAAREAELGQEATTTTVEPPDLETLMAWEAEGGCEATDGCWVEVDGVCPHGCQSWFLELGLI